MSDPVLELCSLYDLAHEDALRILRESIGEALGYSVTSDAEIDGKIVFYAPKGDGVKKIIRYSPLLEKRVRKLITEKIDYLRMQVLKNQGIKIINGTILERNKRGITLSTKTGKAFAPQQMLIKEEEPFYQVGTNLDFHIRKITPRGLVLDRRSDVLLTHTLKKLLPKGFILYQVNRKFGKRIKVYSRALPDKADLERIRMAFVEHIDFVMYDSAQLENIINKGMIL